MAGMGLNMAQASPRFLLPRLSWQPKFTTRSLNTISNTQLAPPRLMSIMLRNPAHHRAFHATARKVSYVLNMIAKSSLTSDPGSRSPLRYPEVRSKVTGGRIYGATICSDDESP